MFTPNDGKSIYQKKNDLMNYLEDFVLSKHKAGENRYGALLAHLEEQLYKKVPPEVSFKAHARYLFNRIKQRLREKEGYLIGIHYSRQLVSPEEASQEDAKIVINRMARSIKGSLESAATLAHQHGFHEEAECFLRMLGESNEVEIEKEKATTT